MVTGLVKIYEPWIDWKLKMCGHVSLALVKIKDVSKQVLMNLVLTLTVFITGFFNCVIVFCCHDDNLTL